MSERDPNLQTVIDMALSLLPHEMGCDNCFDYLAAYADHMTNGTTIPEHLRMVREHLARCVSCEEEPTFLLEAMKAQGEEHNNAEG
jgi:hypothetical protein